MTNQYCGFFDLPDREAVKRIRRQGPEDKKAPIEGGFERSERAHKAQDIDKIDSASAALNTAWQAASQEDLPSFSRGWCERLAWRCRS